MNTTNKRGHDEGWEAVVAGAVDRGLAEERAQKQDRSRRRRQEIVQAAVRVFARDGIARARIADIAAEAGVAVSSVYDYYATKEDIAYAVPTAKMGEFFAEFTEKARSATTARERLRLYLWLTADFARRNPDWARTLYLEVWPSVLVEKTPVRRTLDDYGRVTLSLIGEGGRNGDWAPDANPYQTATIFIGAVSQLLITWLLYKRPRDLMKATGSLVDRLLSLLGPMPQPIPGDDKRKSAPSRSFSRQARLASTRTP
jgi:AcrR family transcriptional regulator